METDRSDVAGGSISINATKPHRGKDGSRYWRYKLGIVTDDAEGSIQEIDAAEMLFARPMRRVEVLRQQALSPITSTAVRQVRLFDLYLFFVQILRCLCCAVLCTVPGCRPVSCRNI